MSEPIARVPGIVIGEAVDNAVRAAEADASRHPENALSGHVATMVGFIRDMRAERERHHAEVMWWVNQVSKQGRDVGEAWERSNKVLLEEIERLRGVK